MPLIKSPADAEWTVRLELEASPQVAAGEVEHLLHEIRTKLPHHVTAHDGEAFAVEQVDGNMLAVWIVVEAESEKLAGDRVRQALLKAGEEFELADEHIQAVWIRRRWETKPAAADPDEVDDLQPLVGMKELRELLHLSKQRTAVIVKRPGFPDPVVDLGSGPVWDTVKVKRFVTAWEPHRRRGRPRKTA